MVRKREKKQILIVEDNEINRMILSEILSDEYQVLEAENGLEALHILRQNKDSIDIILLDVMMPVMDGYTFLDKMKEDDELSTVPVIVMTQGTVRKMRFPLWHTAQPTLYRSLTVRG